MAAQAQSVVDSTLEIIDISGVHESPSREANVGVHEFSSPHGFPPSFLMRVHDGAQPPGPQTPGALHCKL